LPLRREQRSSGHEVQSAVACESRIRFEIASVTWRYGQASPAREEDPFTKK
jgi:hypothetical protein